MFSFWGTDWFHYQEIFSAIKSDQFTSTHMEPFYVWIIQNLSPNYLSFRLLVWGGAFFFYIKTLKILKISPCFAMLFFVASPLIWFSYSRTSLAMGLMFLATAFILQKNTHLRLLHLLIGFAGLIASIYLHKSAVVGVLIILLVLLLNTLLSKSYKLLILLIPFLGVGMRLLLSNIGDFVTGDEYMNFVVDSASRNMESESSVMGIGSLIQSFMEKAAYFMTAICGILIQRKNQNVPKPIIIFSNILILLVIVSTLLLLVGDLNMNTMSVRLFRFSMIPFTIVLVFCWQNGLNVKLVRATFLVSFVSTIYQLLYALYVIM
jgi:hypothetical protein